MHMLYIQIRNFFECEYKIKHWVIFEKQTFILQTKHVLYIQENSYPDLAGVYISVDMPYIYKCFTCNAYI